MKKEEMMNEALEMLKSDDDLFCAMVDEVDTWSDIADGFRCYEMCEIDNIFCEMKISDFLDELDEFNHKDDYFYGSIYGIESTNDKAGLYRDNVDEDDLLDEIIDKKNHLYFDDSDFEELIDNIINYDKDEQEEE